MKRAPFDFSNDCLQAFNKLKEKLTTAPIIAALDWSLPFKIMCNASDFVLDAVWAKEEQEFSHSILRKPDIE